MPVKAIPMDKKGVKAAKSDADITAQPETKKKNKPNKLRARTRRFKSLSRFTAIPTIAMDTIVWTISAAIAEPMAPKGITRNKFNPIEIKAATPEIMFNDFKLPLAVSKVPKTKLKLIENMANIKRQKTRNELLSTRSL